MSPVLAEEKVERFQNLVGSTERVGVSEFARSKGWRERLPETGCFEVVDRGGVVGYMLAPDYARALADTIEQLEEQVERAQIAAMFDAREGRDEVKSGADLRDGALTYLDANGDRLRGIVDGG